MNLTVIIPAQGEVLVKSGQKVDFTTPFVRTGRARKVALPVAQMMKFPPHKIFHMLKKGIGDEINRGDLLAEYKSLFATRQYFSDVPGRIVHVDHEVGTVIIEDTKTQNDMVKCFFTGEIEGIDAHKLELKVQQARQIPLVSRAKRSGGQIYYLDTSSSDFTEDDIAHKYIVTDIVDHIQLAKLDALGARGVVLPKKAHSINDLDHLILQSADDFDHVRSHKYPYCMVGVEQNTLYFYS